MASVHCDCYPVLPWRLILARPGSAGRRAGCLQVSLMYLFFLLQTPPPLNTTKLIPSSHLAIQPSIHQPSIRHFFVLRSLACSTPPTPIPPRHRCNHSLCSDRSAPVRQVSLSASGVPRCPTPRRACSAIDARARSYKDEKGIVIKAIHHYHHGS